jgi:hypothetical protein
MMDMYFELHQQMPHLLERVEDSTTGYTVPDDIVNLFGKKIVFILRTLKETEY